MKLSSIPLSIKIASEIFGLWPNKSRIFFYLITCSLLTSSLTFEIWNYLYIYNDIMRLMDSIIISSAEMMCLIKLIILRVKRRDIISVIENIEKDCENIKTVEDQCFIRRNEKFSKNFHIFTTINYMSAVTFFVISAVYYNREKKIFVYEAKYPFDAYKSPTFEIIFILQTLGLYITSSGNAFINGLCISMIMHLSARIDIMKEEIRRLSRIPVDSNHEQEIRDIIKSLAQDYDYITWFMEKVQGIFSLQMFAQIGLSTLELCAAGYILVTLTGDEAKDVQMDQVLKFMTVYMASLLVITIDCAAGDYLQRKNELIHREIFACNWYNFKLSERKALQIIMMRSQKPMIIMAGNLISMTHQSLMSVIKTSVSYISVLRAVK